MASLASVGRESRIGPATRSSVRFSDLLMPIAVLLAAALLRLGWLGIAEFKLDEAALAQLALNLVRGRSLPLQGTGSSTGLPSGPGAAYIYALPFLFSSDPFLATWFTAALNMVGVALCWWLGQRYWNRTAAFFAGLLFATSPWAVIASRKIWEPDLLPPFALAYIITALLGFVERRRWAVAVHLGLLGLIVQIHFSGLALVPLTVVLLIAYRRGIDWRAALLGASLIAVEALPLAYRMWAQRRHIEAGAIADLLSQPVQMDGASVRFWWMLSTGSDIQSLAGWRAYADFLRLLPNLGALRSALGVLIVAAIVFLLWPARSKPEETSAAAGRVVALWALAPLLLLVLHTAPVYPHYFYVSFPAQSLAAGALLANVASAHLKPLRWVTIASVLAIAFAQVVTVLTVLNFVGSHATSGGFGTPLEFQRQAAKRAGAPGEPVIVLADDDNPMQSDWAAAFGFLLQGVPHRLLNGARGALLPQGRATALITPGAHVAVQAYTLAGIQDLGEVIYTRSGEEPFGVLRLEGQQHPQWQTIEPLQRLANGAAIVGYDTDGVAKQGQPFTWWLIWRVDQLPPDRGVRYHIFNHLIDSQGVRWAQADGPTYSTNDWLVGDVAVQAFQLQVPVEAGTGPFWMRVGMYTYPEIENQAVLDAAGHAVGDAIILGPVPGE